MNDIRFLFRVDCNETIATGHVMRCLSLARAVWEDCGRGRGAVSFIISERDTERLLKTFLTDEEMNLTEIFFLEKGIASNPRQETEELWELLSRIGEEYGFAEDKKSEACKKNIKNIKKIKDPGLRKLPLVLVVDNYNVTETYLACLRKLIRVAYIDDLELFDHPVDYLINYNIDAPDYGGRAGRTLLTGIEYAPLRSEFAEIKHTPGQKVTDIVFSTGGGDREHLALGFLKNAVEIPAVLDSAATEDETGFGRLSFEGSREVKIHILLGSLSPDEELLRRLASGDPRIIIHKNIKNVAELFASCSIGICAAGTTLYEMCAAGLPVISYSFTEDQRICGTGFGAAGLGYYAGDAAEAGFWDGIIKYINLYGSSAGSRREASEKEKKALDGGGAARIVRAIMDGLIKKEPEE